MNKSARAWEQKQLREVVASSSPGDGDDASLLLLDRALVDAKCSTDGVGACEKKSGFITIILTIHNT